MKKKNASGQRFLVSKKELKETIKEVVVPLFNQVNDRIDGVESGLGGRMDGLDKRMDGLEKGLGGRMDDLEKGLGGRMDDLEVSVAAIHKDLSIHKNETANNFDYLFTKIDALENEYHVLHFHIKDWDVLKRDTRRNRERIEKVEIQVKELCNKI